MREKFRAKKNLGVKMALFDFFLPKNAFFGHIFGFFCIFQFERKNDFSPYVRCLLFGVQNGPFWARNSFLTIFLDFCALFSLNLVKNCKRIRLREKTILALLFLF